MAMDALRKRTDEFAFMVNEREQTALNSVLDTALDQGWTPKQLSDEISQTFADGYHITNDAGEIVRTVPSDSWAEMVARTELNRAQTMGALDLFNAAGIEKVQWVSNGTPCDECADLDGEIYDIADAPPCPFHPRCNCALTAADDDVKYTPDEDTSVMDQANAENDAALKRYMESR